MAAAEVGKPTWTQPGMVQAMKTWKQLSTNGVFQSGLLADYQYPTGANLFAAGRVGMMLLGSWWLQESKLPPPQPAPVHNLQDFSFFAFPAIKAGGHPSPYIGGIDVGWGVTKAAKKNQAAVDLVLKSLIQGGMEHQALNTLNDMPAFKGLKPTTSMTSHLRKLYARYEAILPHTVSHEIGSPEISQALVNAMDAVAAGRLSPKAAMAEVNRTALKQAH
jgi:raffinose/stachyose/melibiose transport system substrate-binding protein